jgi:hypothetical protein
MRIHIPVQTNIERGVIPQLDGHLEQTREGQADADSGQADRSRPEDAQSPRHDSAPPVLAVATLRLRENGPIESISPRHVVPAKQQLHTATNL